MTDRRNDDLGAEETDTVGFSIRVADSIHAIEAKAWDRLAIQGAADLRRPHPFLAHAFLASLEDSGCVGQRTGWLAQYLLLEDESGHVIAATPSFLKGHSQGEYVFDHGWADAFERAGGRYYPKLQISVPFTPVTGPRLLVGDDRGASIRREALVQGIEAYVRQTGVSSAHATFLNAEDLVPMLEAGFLHRTDQQFHFINRGYASYDDFLDTLASRKRKALRKERREALADGIVIEHLSGASITEEAWDAFFSFYMDTAGRKWGRPYLNRRFFQLIGERMPDALVLVMAKREGRYIAGALNFVDEERIYGRYWGCVEDRPFLHFEVCYHQAIDYAIEHGLRIVEAGAQGEHKLARGYEPVLTHSAHFIAHSGLREAIEQYLQRERIQVTLSQPELSAATPFRKGAFEGVRDGE